jgi:hypothetical protein
MRIVELSDAEWAVMVASTLSTFVESSAAEHPIVCSELSYALTNGKMLLTDVEMINLEDKLISLGKSLINASEA